MLFFGVQCRCSEYKVRKLYHLSIKKKEEFKEREKLL